jgi:DNA-binding transcriptional LysR family regulator
MAVSLRQLRAFRAVAEARSFTAAAEGLGLTQAAVSILIRQFETELRVSLFQRTGRGAHLTDVGTEILPTVLRLLDDLRDITESANDLRRLRRGHLRLAVPQMLGCCWLPQVLETFRRHHPGIEVSIVDTAVDGVIDLVAGGEAEIGIGPERAPPAGIEAEHLWDTPMQLVLRQGSPLCAADLSPDMKAIETARWITYSDDFNEVLHRSLLGHGATRRAGDMRVLGMMSALAIVGREDYVTVAPAYARIFAPVFDLIFLHFDGAANTRRFMQYTRARHDLSPAARAFLDLARISAPG